MLQHVLKLLYGKQESKSIKSYWWKTILGRSCDYLQKEKQSKLSGYSITSRDTKTLTQDTKQDLLLAFLLACRLNTPRFSVNYLDTYASIVKHYSIRLVLPIVVLKDLEIIQLDKKTAFLYWELVEELYLQQSEGYVIPGKKTGSVTF